jgi:hypothetical protein
LQIPAGNFPPDISAAANMAGSAAIWALKVVDLDQRMLFQLA